MRPYLFLLCFLTHTASGQILWEKYVGLPPQASRTERIVELTTGRFAVLRHEPNAAGRAEVAIRWYDPNCAVVDSLKFLPAPGELYALNSARATPDGALRLFRVQLDPADGTDPRWTLLRVAPAGMDPLLTHTWTEAADEWRFGRALSLPEGGWLVSDLIYAAGRLSQARVLRFGTDGTLVWSRTFTDALSSRSALFQHLAYTPERIYAAGTRGFVHLLFELDARTGETIRQWDMGQVISWINGLVSFSTITSLYATPDGRVFYTQNDGGRTVVGTIGAALQPSPYLDTLLHSYRFVHRAPVDDAAAPVLEALAGDTLRRLTLDDSLRRIDETVLAYPDVAPPANRSWRAWYRGHTNRLYRTWSNDYDDVEMPERGFSVLEPGAARRDLTLGIDNRSTHERALALYPYRDWYQLAVQRTEQPDPDAASSHFEYLDFLDIDPDGTLRRATRGLPVDHVPARILPLADDGWITLHPTGGLLVYELSRIARSPDERWTTTLVTRNLPTLELRAEGNDLWVENFEQTNRYDLTTGTLLDVQKRDFDTHRPFQKLHFRRFGPDRLFNTTAVGTGDERRTILGIFDRTGVLLREFDFDLPGKNTTVRVFPLEDEFIFTYQLETTPGADALGLVRVDADLEVLDRTIWQNATVRVPGAANRPVRTPYGIWFDHDLFWWTPTGVVDAKPYDVGPYLALFPTDRPYEYLAVRDAPRFGNRDVQLVRFRIPERTTAPPLLALRDEVRVYPNPGTGAYRWSTREISESAVRYRVLDDRGVVLLDRQLTPAPDNLNTAVVFQLPPYATAGIYFLEVRFASGRRRSATFVHR